MTISMFQPNSLHSLPITWGKDSNQPRLKTDTAQNQWADDTGWRQPNNASDAGGIISSRLSIVLQRQAPTQGGEEAF